MQTLEKPEITRETMGEVRTEACSSMRPTNLLLDVVNWLGSRSEATRRMRSLILEL